MEVYYTFLSTHAVILAEKILLSGGINVRVRPVPSSIKAGCGLCLCVLINQRAQVEQLMQKSCVTFLQAYLFKDGQFSALDKL